MELNLSIQAVTAADTVVTVNWPLAQGYRDALRDLAQRMELPDDLTAGMVARFPDVLAQTAAPANEDELWQGRAGGGAAGAGRFCGHARGRG